MSFFDGLERYSDQLESASANLEQLVICRAGDVVRVRISSQYLSTITQQIGHLVWDTPETSSISFLEYSDEIRFPFKIESEHASNGLFEFRFLVFLDLVVISDITTQSHHVIYRSSKPPITSDYLRVIFQLVCPSKAHPIHGGSVSWGASAALISNVGGSGKSSLIASSVLAGASTTGDDFGLFELEPKKVKIWSQFATFKLGDSSPTNKLFSSTGIAQSGEKRVFEFNKLRVNCTVPFHSISKIFIPRIGEEFSLQLCAPLDAFRKIAPSSSGLALNRQATNLAIAQLCEQIDAFDLVLGPNSEENAGLLKEALET